MDRGLHSPDLQDTRGVRLSITATTIPLWLNLLKTEMKHYSLLCCARIITCSWLHFVRN